MLKHNDIWRAIDQLAARHSLSPSGLARKAGLSATSFNPTKRVANGRKRWPSTESIARILKATGTGLDEFTALAAPGGGNSASPLPLARLDEIKSGWFDEEGRPAGREWDSFRFPALPGADCFALEVAGAEYEPVYRDGDILILSPSAPLRRGDRVAVQLHGTIRLGRLVRQTAQKIELADLAAGSPVSAPVRDIGWIARILWAGQ